MSFLDQLFSREKPNAVMQPLYDSIIKEGRQIYWYEDGAVPDTLDGRFDMIGAIFALVLIRLEQDESTMKETAWLTELFVTDMDGQIRQLGIGDMVVGKHIKRMMQALGGRISAYRDSIAEPKKLKEALVRNLYRGEAPAPNAVEFVSVHLSQFHADLCNRSIADVISGRIPEVQK